MFKLKYQYTIPKTCITLSVDRQYIHKQDSWSADMEIAEIALPLIQQLKKNTHSYPGKYDGYDVTFDKVWSVIEPYWKGVDEKEWNIVLDKIIMAFYYYNNFDDINEIYFKSYGLNTGIEIIKQLEFDAMCGMFLFARYFLHLWD